MKNDLRLDDLRLLLAIQRSGSFLSAGRALGLATSTVARRIAALEAALGRSLVTRSAAGTMIEPDALPLVALAEQMELGLDALRRDRLAASKLAGVVRLSVSDGFVRPITEALAELRRLHPEIEIELISETRLSDVARRESDLGLRITRSSSRVLVERRLGVATLALYASRSYVDRRLPSATLQPGELGRHDFVGFHGALRSLPSQRFLEAEGATRFPFRSNSDASQLEATRQGQGIAVLSDITGRQEGLVRLRFARAVPALTIYLVSHRETRRTPRIQLVARAVETAVRERLASP